jgi:hypothetical protein
VTSSQVRVKVNVRVGITPSCGLVVGYVIKVKRIDKYQQAIDNE